MLLPIVDRAAGLKNGVLDVWIRNNHIKNLDKTIKYTTDEGMEESVLIRRYKNFYCLHIDDKTKMSQDEFKQVVSDVTDAPIYILQSGNNKFSLKTNLTAGEIEVAGSLPATQDVPDVADGIYCNIFTEDSKDDNYNCIVHYCGSYFINPKNNSCLLPVYSIPCSQVSYHYS